MKDNFNFRLTMAKKCIYVPDTSVHTAGSFTALFILISFYKYNPVLKYFAMSHTLKAISICN